ncbi:unnamed protein product, partial [Oikopleura dioica]
EAGSNSAGGGEAQQPLLNIVNQSNNNDYDNATWSVPVPSAFHMADASNVEIFYDKNTTDDVGATTGATSVDQKVNL